MGSGGICAPAGSSELSETVALLVHQIHLGNFFAGFNGMIFQPRWLLETFRVGANPTINSSSFPQIISWTRLAGAGCALRGNTQWIILTTSS